MKKSKSFIWQTTLLLGMVAFHSNQVDAGAPTPVVLFPAYHLTRLKVTAKSQTVASECPRSGAFEYWYGNSTPSNEFTQTCQDRLLTLAYAPDRRKPMPLRFSDQPGVFVAIESYGETQSAPFYEPLYTFLEQHGYVRNVSIRVAGYDARLTPDMNGFLDKTRALIEQTYEQNNQTPVHLVGHSNGPLYAQYLLTHTSAAWKKQYIHGFTPIAGNFPGQGLLYTVLFTGLNIIDFSFPTHAINAASSANMHLSHPATYMSASDPAIFSDREIVLKTLTPSRRFTPRDRLGLLVKAHLQNFREIAEYYTGFVKFSSPRFYPNVDVYAEKGSRLSTFVGAQLPDLTVGQVFTPTKANMLTRDGDSNQEDITNDAVLIWRNMPCHHFQLTDNPGVSHFDLPSSPPLLQRLLKNLNRPKADCA